MPYDVTFYVILYIVEEGIAYAGSRLFKIELQFNSRRSENEN